LPAGTIVNREWLAVEGAFVFEPVVFGGRWYLVAMEEEGSQKVGGRVSDRKK